MIESYSIMGCIFVVAFIIIMAIAKLIYKINFGSWKIVKLSVSLGLIIYVSFTIFSLLVLDFNLGTYPIESIIATIFGGIGFCLGSIMMGVIMYGTTRYLIEKIK